MSQEDEFASAYYRGLTQFEEWRVGYETQLDKEKMEEAAGQFLAVFEQMFPQEYKQMQRDPKVRAAVRKFRKER